MRVSLMIAALVAAALLSQGRPAEGGGKPGKGDRIKGYAEFEKVPVDDGGLRLADTRRAPMRGVEVDLLRGETVVETTFTEESGKFGFFAQGLTGTFRIRIRAASQNVSVALASDPTKVFEIRSNPFTLAEGQVIERNILAPANNSQRVSGAFNILDVALYANAIVGRTVSNFNPPTVRYRWSKNNRRRMFVPHVDGSFDLQLRGHRGTDSDEFDDHVVASLYGQALLKQGGGSDSPYFDTPLPDEDLIPTIAWQEGWGRFFACHLLDEVDPQGEPIYRDSFRGGVRRLDLEENAPGLDFGIGSAHSAASMLWDLYDASSDEGDTLVSSFHSIWNITRGLFTSLPDKDIQDFARAVNAASGGTLTEALTNLLAARFIPFNDPDHEHPTPLTPAVTVEAAVTSLVTRSSLRFASSALWVFTLDAPTQISILGRHDGGENPQRDTIRFLLMGPGSTSPTILATLSSQGAGFESTFVAPAGRYTIEVDSVLFVGGSLRFNQAFYRLLVAGFSPAAPGVRRMAAPPLRHDGPACVPPSRGAAPADHCRRSPGPQAEFAALDPPPAPRVRRREHQREITDRPPDKSNSSAASESPFRSERAIPPASARRAVPQHPGAEA